MQIKLIAEGSTKWERLIKHWGIAFLIGDDVLFDTFGDAKVFLRNLKAMKVDPSKIRHIIVSHDHWDHLAGLWPMLEQNKNVKVYICPGFSQKTKKRIAAFGVPLIEAVGPMEVRPGIYTTGQIKGIYDGQDIDEQAIVIKTPQGIVIVTGCAHPGIATVINKVREFFFEKVFLVIGGFHLKDSSPERIEKVIDMLKTITVEKVAPLHCTGSVACDMLRNSYGSDYIHLSTGQSLEI